MDHGKGKLEMARQHPMKKVNMKIEEMGGGETDIEKGESGEVDKSPRSDPRVAKM